MDSSVAESGKCPPPVLRPSDSPPLLLQAALGIVALAFLYLLSRQNYLLYHGIVEIFSVVVSVTIFSIGWNARRFAPDNTLLILAVAYLPVAILDFLHVLGYMGMGIFAGRGADLPTQLWIAARYLESISLLLVALLLGSGRRLRPGWFLATSLLVGAALIAVIVPWPIFPACYVEGQGLTPFKVASEYIISGLLVLAAFLFWRHRQAIQPRLLFLLIASVALTVLSELSFTLYFDVYGLFNFVGHAFKLFSVILVYFVLVRGSLKSPFESLFRELARELAQRKASEEKLAATNRELNGFVATVAHDLRSPLTPIVGYADFLRQKWQDHLDVEAHELLAKISGLGREMSDTMEDLLVLARVGRLEPPDEPVAVGRMVDGVIEAEAGRKRAICRMSACRRACCARFLPTSSVTPCATEPKEAASASAANGKATWCASTSGTTVRESPRPSAATSSISSIAAPSGNRSRERGWAWPSSRRSPGTTMDGSGWRRRRAAERPSGSRWSVPAPVPLILPIEGRVRRGKVTAHAKSRKTPSKARFRASILCAPSCSGERSRRTSGRI